MSDAISYSELRENLKDHLDKVCSEHAALTVKRRNGEDVVILSKGDYEAMEETAYLLRSPANAGRLLKAVARKKKERVSTSLKALKDEIGV